MCPQHLSEKRERRPPLVEGAKTLDLEDGGVGAAKLVLAV